MKIILAIALVAAMVAGYFWADSYSPSPVAPTAPAASPITSVF